MLIMWLVATVLLLSCTPCDWAGDLGDKPSSDVTIPDNIISDVERPLQVARLLLVACLNPHIDKQPAVHHLFYVGCRVWLL